jgi:hypothetical protein
VWFVGFRLCSLLANAVPSCAYGCIHPDKCTVGLSAQVQTVLQQQPFSGHVFIFRGRRGDRPS